MCISVFFIFLSFLLYICSCIVLWTCVWIKLDWLTAWSISLTFCTQNNNISHSSCNTKCKHKISLLSSQCCCLWPWSLALALKVKALALKVKALALALSKKYLALTNQVLGLARLVFRETNTATMLKADEVIRQATWTVQSTAVHACNISSSREGVLSEWTTDETAQGTDVRHSAWNFSVSQVQQCGTEARSPLDLIPVNC